jgi:hypothetical protein
MSRPSLLVFGSQTSWPSTEHLHRLRIRLISDVTLAEFLDGIRALPDYWAFAVSREPQLDQVPALAFLADILQWIDKGVVYPPVGSMPNALNTPLTVLFHLIQYFDYLRETGNSHSMILQSVQHGGIQGFCTGLLSAVVLACSHTEEDIIQLGLVAIRIALLIGSFIDLDTLTSPEAHEFICLAVRWKNISEKLQVQEIIQDFSGVRIPIPV